MKKVLYIYFFLIIAACVGACQKVINVHLQAGAREYVIEGIITDQPGYCIVSITQTKDFSADNNFPGVSGATVTVENNGVITTLAETGTGTGVYSTAVLTGTPGQTYSMKVNVGGSTFTASSTMPQPVGPDSVYAKKSDFNSDNFANVNYTDPKGVANYYRWIQWVNGRLEKTIFIADDEFSDGLKQQQQLYFNNDTDDDKRKIHNGDSVRVDMICIDSAVYKYWRSLQQNGTGSGNSASPANPISNIQGGCLGYFSAQTVRTRTIKAKL